MRSNVQSGLTGTATLCKLVLTSFSTGFIFASGTCFAVIKIYIFKVMNVKLRKFTIAGSVVLL